MLPLGIIINLTLICSFFLIGCSNGKKKSRFDVGVTKGEIDSENTSETLAEETDTDPKETDKSGEPEKLESQTPSAATSENQLPPLNNEGASQTGTATDPAPSVTNQTASTEPSQLASNLSFSDTDYRAGQIQGILSFSPAQDESNIDSYELYWATAAKSSIGVSPISTIAKTGNDLEINLSTPLTIPDSATHLMIFSKNSFGRSLLGITIEILDQSSPVAPNNLVATAGENEVSLAWTPVGSSGNQFLLIRNPNNSPTFEPGQKNTYELGQNLGNNDTIAYKGVATNFVDDSLQNSVTYHYKLYSLDSNNLYSLEAVTASATPQDTTQPPPPISIDDQERNESLTNSPAITWLAPIDTSDVDHYQLALGLGPGGTDVLDWTDVGTVSTYTYNGILPNGELIFASIRSVDRAGNTSTAILGDGFENLVCPDDTSENGVGTYIKVHGNLTPGLGGQDYTDGTRTTLDWSTADSGNGYRPQAASRKLGDFCVAKYEMKLRHADFNPGSGFTDDIVDNPRSAVPGSYDFAGDYSDTGSRAKFRAVSSPHGRPWLRIATGLDGSTGAVQACEELGTSFTLITNAQWQAIARDITANSVNWNDTDGDPDNHALNRGHSDGTPNYPLEADTTDPFDSDPCFQTDQSLCTDKTNAHYTQKRTHTLNSTGEVIWDFAGNAWEWVADQNHLNQGHGNSGADATGPISTEPFVGDSAGDLQRFKLKYGPAGDHTSKNGPERGGFGQLYDSTSPGGSPNSPEDPGAIIRSGDHSNNAEAGIFAAIMWFTPSDTHPDVGFRCVFSP